MALLHDLYGTFKNKQTFTQYAIANLIQMLRMVYGALNKHLRLY